jgi:hypothetical protein
MRKLTLTVFVLLATPLLSSCLAAAAIGTAGAVVGTTAKVAVKTTGAVVGAAIPDGDDSKKHKD